MELSRPARIVIGACLAWAICLLSLLTAASWSRPAPRALFLMASGLLLLWVLIGGSLQLTFRRRVVERVRAVPLPAAPKFVLFCTLLALAEEGVSTSMTDLAPAFGVDRGRAYITASTDYLDVVAFHSVVIFVPMFAVWAVLLSAFRFRPTTVALLFGLTGLLGETLAFGPQSLLNAGFWILVYALMVYLPAGAFPAGDRRVPGPVHGVLAVLLCVLATVPVVLVVSAVHPQHVHFPPMDSGARPAADGRIGP